jgi:hypothetical protein
MTAWQSHPSDCDCVGCEGEREFIRAMSEMPPSPTTGQRVVTAIKETLAWGSLVVIVLLLAQCAPPGST